MKSEFDINFCINFFKCTLGYSYTFLHKSLINIEPISWTPCAGSRMDQEIHQQQQLSKSFPISALDSHRPCFVCTSQFLSHNPFRALSNWTSNGSKVWNLSLVSIIHELSGTTIFEKCPSRLWCVSANYQLTFIPCHCPSYSKYTLTTKATVLKVALGLS